VIYRDSFPLCLTCGVALRMARVGTNTFARCPSCQSALVDHVTFAAMWAEMAPGRLPPRYEPRKFGHAPRHCPSCSEPMVPVRVLAVPLDWCQEHGVWFDPEELATTLAAAAMPLEAWLLTFTETLRGMS
jgi:Zn-finger nucleic acid-binding protein